MLFVDTELRAIWFVVPGQFHEEDEYIKIKYNKIKNIIKQHDAS